MQPKWNKTRADDVNEIVARLMGEGVPQKQAVALAVEEVEYERARRRRNRDDEG
jgi:hypothetical protein